MREWRPSAPITRSKRRAGPFSKVTSTPSAESVSVATESPNTYSMWFRVRSYMMCASSPRKISTSPLIMSDGKSTFGAPFASTTIWRPMWV